MLQLAPIILVAVLLARDEGLAVSWDRAESWGWSSTLAAFALPIAAILLVSHALVMWCDRRVSQARSAAPLRRAERMIRAARWLIIVHFAACVLVLDWLGLVRSAIGDLVLIDEAVALLPALLGLAGTWWVYYPIEQRVQSALLIRRLDEGQPLYPTLSRLGYTILQSRLHLLVMLVPLLMILGMGEAIEVGAKRFAPVTWVAEITTISTMLAGVIVFIIAPPVICALLDVHRMPGGALRESLLALAKKHKVRLRDVLVWNTAGTMINAAVLGLVGWFRYVLITDALLDAMGRRELLAVMAHEVGHVRRHHMPWLAGALVASLFVATQIVGLPLYFLTDAQIARLQDFVPLDLAVVGLSMALALTGFGWVCRRFERQADTFAVQHLSQEGPGPLAMGLDEETEEAPGGHAPDASGAPSAHGRFVTLEAAEAMQSALQTISRLNAIDRRRPSWRHGSIAWRQDYLATLPGQRISELHIDRVVTRIKAMIAATLLVAIAAIVITATLTPEPVGPAKLIEDAAASDGGSP